VDLLTRGVNLGMSTQSSELPVYKVASGRERDNWSQKTHRSRPYPQKGIFKTGILAIFQTVFGREFLLTNILSFIAARAVFFEDMHPVGLAFVAVLAATGLEQRAAGAAVFLVAGLLTGQDILAGLVHIPLLLYIMVVGRQCRNRHGARVIAPLLTGVGFLVSHAWRPLHTVVFEAFFVFLMTFSLWPVCGFWRKGLDREDREQLVAAGVLAAGVISGVRRLGLFGFHTSEILMRWLVMGSAFAGGAPAGSVIGIITGTIAVLAGAFPLVSLGVLGFAGVLAGVGRVYGKPGVVSGFVLGSVIILQQVAGGNGVLFMTAMLYTVLAGLCFAVLPQTIWDSLACIMPCTGQPGKLQLVRERRLRTMFCSRLEDFAAMFDEFAHTFIQIPLAERDSEDSGKVFSMLCERACKDCSARKHCWEKNFHATYGSFVELLARVEEQGNIGTKDLPPYLHDHCIKAYQLVGAVKQALDVYRMDEHWRRRFHESSRVVASQLAGVSEIIKGLAGEVQMDIEFSGLDEERLRRCLERRGFEPRSLTVVIDRNGQRQVCVEMEAGCPPGVCEEIAAIVSEQLGQTFTVWHEDDTKTGDRDGFYFRLLPEFKYEVVVGVTRISTDGEDICGDYYTRVDLAEGKTALILSDGMGVGQKAALESNATVSMLERMMRTGFDRRFAVRTVNSVLLLRSPEESFSTIDLAVIDRYSGELEVTKIASPPSFIKNGDQIKVIRSASLPVGILREIEVEQQTSYLREGDLLVMLTDGVLEAGEGEGERWLVENLKKVESHNPEEAGRKIAELARSRETGGMIDDMTVVVARLQPYGGSGLTAKEVTPYQRINGARSAVAG